MWNPEGLHLHTWQIHFELKWGWLLGVSADCCYLESLVEDVLPSRMLKQGERVRRTTHGLVTVSFPKWHTSSFLTAHWHSWRHGGAPQEMAGNCWGVQWAFDSIKIESCWLCHREWNISALDSTGQGQPSGPEALEGQWLSQGLSHAFPDNLSCQVSHVGAEIHFPEIACPPTKGGCKQKFPKYQPWKDLDPIFSV